MGRAPPRAHVAPALLLTLAGLATVPPASAQNQGLVVRDGTLGSGPDGVVAPGPDDLGQADYLIRADLGEQRGRNLFHSFLRFSIGSGERATFTDEGAPSPGEIENVISRVTGGEYSQIDGTLHSTIPGADVWLLNPSGVVFGAGAELDVKGSFHGGTGDYVGFGEGGLERYYADGRPSSVLATAPPAAFGFLPETTHAASLAVDRTRLEVDPGETLELVGRDHLSLTGAELLAPGGHVGLEAQGEVALSDSLVDVGREGKAPGTVSLRGGQIFIQDDSKVLAENESPLPTKPRRGWKRERPAAAPLGSISVEAGESVTVDGGLLSVSTWSAGQAGTIRIEPLAEGDPSPDVTIAGSTARTRPRSEQPFFRRRRVLKRTTNGILDAGTNGTGNAGVVEIHAGELVLEDGGVIRAPTNGVGAAAGSIRGDAGTIRIDADSISVAGVGGDQNSIIHVRSDRSLGRAGTIEITTRFLELTETGVINAASQDFLPLVVLPGGDAGSITIVADEVRIGGWGRATTVNRFGAPLINASSGTSGLAGSIDMTARTLTIDRGGSIQASNTGSGGGGTIQITASESILVDAEVTSPAEQHLPPATVFETLSGIRPVPSGIYSSQSPVRPSADADLAPGLIHLVAPEITLTNGAFVPTNTVGGGAAGNLLIEGRRVHILNGARLTSASFLHPITGLPGGDAGSVTITAKELIEVVGRHPNPRSDLVSTVNSVAASRGDAGAVTLRAPRIVIDQGAVATTVAESAVPTDQEVPPAGGIITLDAGFEGGQVIVRNGGRIDASTFVAGEGGQIDIRAGGSIRVEGTGVDGTGSSIASRTGASGTGGDVVLRAPRIEIARGGQVSAESAPGFETFEGIFTQFFSSVLFGSLFQLPTKVEGQVTGDAGSIALQASHLVHLDGGDITTSVGVAKGGNITIDPLFVILQHGSQVVATAGPGGTGGHIRIAADNFFQFPGSVVSAVSGTPELSGTVEIHSPDVNLAGTLAPLPSAFLDAGSLMRERCAARRSGERAGSFSVRGPGGIPAEPDGWLRAPVVLADATATTAATPAQPALFASLPGPLLAAGACP